jgi:hypothetical protein
MALPVNYKASLLLFFLFLVCTGAAAGPADEALVTPAATPVPFTITLFIPSPETIHSDMILDQVNTPEGGVLFGTSFGLSQYNGTWSTRHINRDNITEGLMDDFVTAVEYDRNGNVWIGYPGGIQVYNGQYYQTFRDQQLLKDPRIQDLQRWHDDIWVATGHSGIHRYREGTWTWFQPMSEDGPGFYEIKSMTIDPASDSLVIATVDEGIWIVKSPDDPVRFEQIAQKDGSYTGLEQVRRDPLGGVYFFNDTTVVHYSAKNGFEPVLMVQDLSMEAISINDLAASPDGKLYLATDNGIYVWSNGTNYRHLGRFEGIGTSFGVRTVWIDAKNRVWFSTGGHVGFYREITGLQGQIQIEIVTLATTAPAPSSPGTTMTARATPSITPRPDAGTSPGNEGLSPVLDPILRALNAILAKFGLVPGS